MSQNRCFIYKGQYYDVGTKVKIKTRWNGEIITTFLGYNRFKDVLKYEIPVCAQIEHYIVEIIEPVYYKEPEPTKHFFLPAGDGPFYALLWYIVVMVVGTIFKDRLLIWIVATWIFFSYIKKK
jgi:hypothetical protein